MSKKRKYLYIGVSLTFILLIGITLGGSWYLLDYALKPGDRSRNEALAWHETDSIYPGMIAWRDSLENKSALKDTTILASDGAKLHAWYVKAPSATSRTALLVHGYTDCGIRILPLGRMYLNDLKMNILVPDLRNAGRSDGDHFQMGWLDRLDVKEWTKIAPKLFSDSVKIVVHGVSMGAATTMMLSGDADVPTNVKLYIEDCGYTSVYDEYKRELKGRFGLPAFPLMPTASALCQLRYGWNFKEASALNQVKKCQRPMFFIHGTADDFVPTWMVHPLYEAKPSPKSLWLAPDAQHARSYQKYPQEYTQRVYKFLHQYHFL